MNLFKWNCKPYVFSKLNIYRLIKDIVNQTRYIRHNRMKQYNLMCDNKIYFFFEIKVL